jgi:hypothetical protein
MKYLFFIICSVFLISCSESPKFRLLSSNETGIDFSNSITETESLNILTYQYLYNGAGVGIGDLNNDGMQDIIFAANQVSPKIYLNAGNFRFTDITSNFEGLTNDQWYSGVAIVDINSDGLPDVYLTSTGNKDPQKCKNRLWINMGINDRGSPSFSEMAEKYGIAEDGPSVAATFFDYDRDGDLDLYILNSSETERMNTSYLQKITDGSARNNDNLYRNNGNGTFTEVTREAGIVYEGYGLGVAIGDINKDGYPDIYVSNDYNSNDLLYINQRDGTFRNEIRKYISYQTRSSMGNDMADINNDGNPDIITLDMLPESYAKRKQTINAASYIHYLNDEKYGYEHQYVRNMLHLHNGFIDGNMLPYSEVGQITGISKTEWSWAPLFADYDNDGDKDLIVTNGYPRDMTDKDWFQFRIKNQGSGMSNLEIINMMPPVKVPNIAFENKNDLNFIKNTTWLPDIPSFSYGASYTDLDNDGDLDYVVNNLNDQAFILRNNTKEKSRAKANFINIRLKGKNGNTMAIGAKVELWNKSGYQFFENFLTRGYASSVEPVIHFGLSEDKRIDSIKITWPASGYTTLLKDIPVNQTIEIDEIKEIKEINGKNTLHSNKAIRNSLKKDLLFTECDSILNYKHEQKDFIDFYLSQKTIPHKFSQIGPCMVKGDIDNDGREDLIIGTTNKLPTTVFLRRGKGFEQILLKGLTSPKEYSESDLAVLDIDNDDDNDIVAVAGGLEYRNESEKQGNVYMATAAGFSAQDETKYQHYLYENQVDSFKRILLPVPPFLASVVRPCDFNHDGNQELFIGSRVEKGKFPYANPSWLIFNNKGKLTVSSSSRLDLGMVTDAVWTDYDGDGWEDLFVAREWDSPVILKNMKGKELVAQIIPELDIQHGLWYSVITADFDLDGDDDYMLGNLGENNQFSVSLEYPLILYALDFEMDGVLDPFMTAFWKDQNGKMKEYPVNYLDELKEQSSFFQKRFKDYTSFSYTGTNDILDDNMMKRVEYKLHVNTLSSCILWNENGKFRQEKLPRSLQVSPVKKMIVQDLNNDKYPDVIVAGNDYTWDVSNGFFDALKGTVLINRGKDCSFDLLPPSESGLVLQGMVESLLYFAGDTSLVVAGINRGEAVVFEKRK